MRSILILFILFLSFVPVYAQDKGQSSVITVDGRGEIKAEADTAKLNVTSTSKGATAQEAVKTNSNSANKLLSTLTSAGIDSKDIQTGSISVFPITDFSNNSQGQIIGYEASNSFNVTVRKVSDVGKIIDLVSQAGDFTISGITFSINDDTSLKDEAYKLAVKNARHKADIIAKEANRQISGIKSITLVDSQGPIFFTSPLSVEKGADTPVIPGDITVSAQVSVQYFIEK